MTSSNALTCLTCRVSFTRADLQRDHYKNEWHGYNLKRKLAQLPAVTYEQFERIEAQHVSNQNSLNKTKDQSSYCDLCRKKFNFKAFEQHIQSKKHQNSIYRKENPNPIGFKKSQNPKLKSKTDLIVKEKLENYVKDEDNDDSEDWESVDSDEDMDEEAIPPNECLFCDNSSDNIEENISHMSVNHSFFIPDVEFLTDLEGLIRYLGEKIGCGHCCLWCCDKGKQFHSKKSAQQHMIDKGHSKMKYEHSGDALLEYSDFYDYSMSYPDSNDKEVNSDQEVLIPHLYDEDWQLTLPSGAVIGHRSLFRYYKQNLKPLTESTEKSHSKTSAILGKVMSQYRALGWTGTTGDAALQKAKDIKFLHRIQRRHELKMGQKNNRLLQTHFRSQIGF